jgi:hypothetical protein
MKSFFIWYESSLFHSAVVRKIRTIHKQAWYCAGFVNVERSVSTSGAIVSVQIGRLLVI